MGPDCVTTKSYGMEPFCGTSAAAPYVGGIVALLLEQSPGLTPNQVIYGLQEFTETNYGPVSEKYDYAYGFGKADAGFITDPDKINEILESDFDLMSLYEGERSTNQTTPQPSDEKPEQQTIPSSGGGCLIATATFGSELAPQVQQLRELRDNTLLQTESGSSFMNSFNDFYYSFSPMIADYERENAVFKEIVKLVITPMISSLSILNYVDMDSESEVIVYGISLILLNIGMYLVFPSVVIIEIRKKF